MKDNEGCAPQVSFLFLTALHYLMVKNETIKALWGMKAENVSGRSALSRRAAFPIPHRFTFVKKINFWLVLLLTKKGEIFIFIQ